MPILSYLRAFNRALAAEMERDPAVCVLGEDIGIAVSNVTIGLLKRFGPERVIDMPISEQAFTSFATGAAMAGARPVVEYQIPALLFLAFEQIANQAHKFPLMTGGQVKVPVTYLLPSSGSRAGWAGQHSDHPYSLFAHVGVKTVVPATPTDAYGLLVSAIRDDDPVILFGPAGAVPRRENVDFGALAPVPLGVGRVHRPGTDVTVVAVGHLVHDALAVAEDLADTISVEVFDPRTLYPFDWAGLAASLERTGRLVVVDDSNRTCGIGGEILATAAEEMHLIAPPKRVTRPDGAVLPFARELDLALQPTRSQLRAAIEAVAKSRVADHRRCRSRGRPADGIQDERGLAGQCHRGAEARRRRQVHHPVRAGRLGAADDVAAADRNLQVGPEAAAGRLDDRLLAGPQAREPVRPRARVAAGRDVAGLVGRKEPGRQPGRVQAGHQVLDVDAHRAAGGDGRRDHVCRVRQAGVQRGPRGGELGLAVPAGRPGQGRGPRVQLAAGQEPERAVRDREPLPVARVQEGRGAGALAVVEHVPAPGQGAGRHVDGNEPDADPAGSGTDGIPAAPGGFARPAGHDRTSAIRTASRRTPSSIWSAVSALHDSRIAWLPPPPV